MPNIESIKLGMDVGYDPAHDPSIFWNAPGALLGQVQPWWLNIDPLIATYTLTDDDSYRKVDGSGGAFTISVPPYAGYMLGRAIWWLMRTDASGNVVTLARTSGSDTINGGASIALTAGKLHMLWCDGANVFRAIALG